MFFLFRNGSEADSMWPASACGNWSGMKRKPKKCETNQKLLNLFHCGDRIILLSLFSFVPRNYILINHIFSSQRISSQLQNQASPSQDHPDKRNVRNFFELSEIVRKRQHLTIGLIICPLSVLSVFQIVKFKNGDCPASDGNRGVCFTGNLFLIVFIKTETIIGFIFSYSRDQSNFPPDSKFNKFPKKLIQ